LALTLAATPARSDPHAVAEPASPPSAAPHEPAPPEDEPADWASISAVFDALVRHYIELTEFTQRIEAEREQRAFDEAAARYERFEEFTRLLTEQRERQLEQEFEGRVAQYIDKLAFTRNLEIERERGETPSTESK
jgi:hypothetical protein